MKTVADLLLNLQRFEIVLDSVYTWMLKIVTDCDQVWMKTGQFESANENINFLRNPVYP